MESLTRDAGLAVSSLLGLSITLVVQTLPIELVVVPDDLGPDELGPGDIGSSLQLTLAALASDDVRGVVTFYAAEAGAFTDLAAFLAGPGTRPTPNLQLDTALRPTLLAGVTGFQELTTINQAIGVLLSRGNNLQQANDLLLRDATNTRTGLYDCATRVLATIG